MTDPNAAVRDTESDLIEVVEAIAALVLMANPCISGAVLPVDGAATPV